MKKFLILFLIFGILAIFPGCALFQPDEKEEIIVPETTENEDADALQAKIDELRDNAENETQSPQISEEKTEEPAVPEVESDTEIEALKTQIKGLEEQLAELKTQKAESYTGQNFIVLTDPASDFDTHEEPVIFTGAVSPNTTKIVVTASHGDKNCSLDADDMCFLYEEDVYTLKAFKAGDTTFTYRAMISYNNLWFGSNNYKFTAYFDDGTAKSDTAAGFYSEPGAEMGKPVIYLYPKKTIKISVNVKPTNGISVSIPKIGNGWEVIATPKGKITNLSDNKIYPYLFWEGFASNFTTPEEGFVVKSDEIAKFFDKKLKKLGLNKKEIADFKEFWVPRLNKDPYYFITFIPQEEFDQYAPLTIEPKPDSVIRVFFDYKGLDKKIDVKEQKLETPARDGFSVVEWGGRLYR